MSGYKTPDAPDERESPLVWIVVFIASLISFFIACGLAGYFYQRFI